MLKGKNKYRKKRLNAKENRGKKLNLEKEIKMVGKKPRRQEYNNKGKEKDKNNKTH